MLLSDAIDNFLLFRRAENLSPRTITWYEHHLGVFAEWLATPQSKYSDWLHSPVHVADIRTIDVVRYMADQSDVNRKPKPLKGYTLRSRYSTLRSFFNWCEDNEEIGNPPSPIGHGKKKKVKPPKMGKPATKFVPYDHYKRFIASIEPTTWQQARDRLIAVVLFWTGVRLQELVDLHYSDFDTQRGLLNVREGKGKKQRFIPFANEIVRPALLQYVWSRPVWDGPELWVGEAANEIGKPIKPLKPEGVRQILIRRCKRAHIPYYNPHSWRHAFGEWLINAGVSIAAVSTILGHSSVKVTEEVYAHIKLPAIRREYAAAVDFMMDIDMNGKEVFW